MVRPAGFFSELSPGWRLPLNGSIKDAVKSIGEPDEKEFVTYLKNGTGIWSEMSAGPDILDPEGPIMTGIGSLYTDGEWIWREDLAHYVTKYHVSLPVEFVTHMRALGHKAPRVPESRLVEILTQDLGITMD